MSEQEAMTIHPKLIEKTSLSIILFSVFFSSFHYHNLNVQIHNCKVRENKNKKITKTYNYLVPLQ